MHAFAHTQPPAPALADAARTLAHGFEAGLIVVQPGDDADQLDACLSDLDTYFDALRADGEKGGVA